MSNSHVLSPRNQTTTCPAPTWDVPKIHTSNCTDPTFKCPTTVCPIPMCPTNTFSMHVNTPLANIFICDFCEGQGNRTGDLPIVSGASCYYVLCMYAYKFILNVCVMYGAIIIHATLKHTVNIEGLKASPRSSFFKVQLYINEHCTQKKLSYE
jgi:hypothetical protein